MTVHPGKLTIIMGDLANERFDDIYYPGAPGGLNYSRLMMGYLISDNEEREMVPGIASDWRISEDGLTWSFTVRQGVKWHDGSEVTPEDILWTLRHYWGPQANDYLAAPSRYSSDMEKIEITGPNEVSMFMTKVYIEMAISVSEATHSWKHMMPARATLGGDEEALAYDKNPIGAGPMKLVGHTPAEVMRFERFDDFYYHPGNGFPLDKRVNFQSLDLFVAPEEATRVAAIRGGDADIAPVSLAAQKQVEAGGGRLEFGQEGVYMMVTVLQCWEPDLPCHDKRVRQALNYAIPKELIQEQLFGGSEVFQTKGWGRVTPSTLGYTPALDPFPYDPDKARQLLADAGYPNGEGFGALIINTAPATSLPFLVESAQLAGESYKRELGIDVEVRVSDRSSIQKASRAWELPGQIKWLDNETRKDAGGAGHDNPDSVYRRHGDPELFPIAAAPSRILNPEERTEALKDLYVRLKDESYTLGVGYVNIPWAVGPSS